MTSAQIVRPRAYSYVRFSTPEQAAGDSLRRQTEKAEKYAAKHGLILDDKLNMHDLGVSAFRGANVAMGALGNFLSLAQHGDIAPGSYLLVENFDRVSRDTIVDAQMVILGLLQGGVTVVTLSNEKAYSKESLRSDQWAIFEIVLGFIRANEESARKQELLRDAWHGKRLKLKDGKPMTKLCPGWLRLKDDRSQFEVIEGRADVVRRIYDMTLVGVGLHSIATALNREGVPVFGTAKLWQSAYIHKVLNSEAVIGRFTPRRRDRGPDGKTVRAAAGETVEGYYPSVVDVETWERVQGMTSGRTSYAAKGNGKGVANMLAGLATCPRCASTMTRANKGSRQRPYLICVRAKTGAGCEYRAIPCHQIEDALVEKADVFYRTMPSPDAGLETEWQRLQEAEEAHGWEISRITDAIKATGHSPALLDTLRQVEADRAEINRKLVEAGERVTASLTNRTQQTVERLVEGLTAEPRDAPTINATLRQLFDRVIVNWPQGDLKFHWRHAPGEVSSVMFAWPRETG